MRPSLSDEQRIAFGRASLVFGATASVAYLVQRQLERLHSGKSNPMLILEEQHTNFYWRVALAAWFGGAMAAAAYRLLRAGPARPAAWDRRAGAWLLVLFPLLVLWAYRYP